MTVNAQPKEEDVDVPTVILNHQQAMTTSTASTVSSGITSAIKKTPEMYLNIHKSKKIAWVESQIKKDQHEAVNPNYKAPFRSTEDTCKRLLRYHVFDEIDTSPWDLEKSDENFEIKSAILIHRYDGSPQKYYIHRMLYT